ncbi:taspase, threonine aspartase, 1 [Chamberlinius hualienensis]
MGVGFVGVHLGAGYHSLRKTDKYLDLCQETCLKTIECLKKGYSAVTAAATAVETLENSPLTNAGIGSNLCTDETVECDASIMDGQSLHFGAVGAVRGIKNPVQFAHKLLQKQSKEHHPLGLVPPSILVGQSASKWAKEHGVTMCEKESELITEDSLRHYKHYRAKVDEFEHRQKTGKVRKLEDASNFYSEISDTVGAIVLDCYGNVAAAASSGGLLLKQPGRLGPAASYACGCWADNGDSDQQLTVATTTSGCGEYLIKTCFAKECANHMLTSNLPAAMALQEAIDKKFLNSRFLKQADKKLVGIIALQYDAKENRGEFLWSHTTDTMCVGYMSVSDKRPVSKMSRLPANGQPGSTIVVEGISIKKRSKH